MDVPASLLMSSVQATMRALLGRVPRLAELAARTNELLHATTPSNRFVTAILFEIFPAPSTSAPDTAIVFY